MKHITTQPDAQTGIKFCATDGNSPDYRARFEAQGLKLGGKRDVAEMVGICVRSVDNLVARGCPHLKLGARKVRFDLNEVASWLKREYSTRRIGKASVTKPEVAASTGAVK